MQPVYRHFPEVKAKHHVLLDFNHLTSPRGFEAVMPKNGTVSPSSGWLGGQHDFYDIFLSVPETAVAPIMPYPESNCEF